jgi:hypothetical protein
VKAIAGPELTSGPLFLSTGQSHQVLIFQVAHLIAARGPVRTSLPTGFLDRVRHALVLFARILRSLFSARSVDLVFLGVRLLASADIMPRLHFSLFQSSLKSIYLAACLVHFRSWSRFFPHLICSCYDSGSFCRSISALIWRFLVMPRRCSTKCM